MPIELGPDVAVTRDADGVVRGLNHIQDPYRGGRSMSMADLAAAYLQDAADVFGIDAEIVAKPDARFDDDKSRLVLVEEKSLMGATTAGFAQHLGALQIWEAGASVTMQEKPAQVVARNPQYRRDVKVDWIDGKPLLAAGEAEPPCRREAPRPRGCEAIRPEDQRAGSVVALSLRPRAAPPSRGRARGEPKRGGRASGPPTLDLPEVDPRLEPGVHYPRRRGALPARAAALGAAELARVRRAGDRLCPLCARVRRVRDRTRVPHRPDGAVRQPLVARKRRDDRRPRCPAQQS